MILCVVVSLLVVSLCIGFVYSYVVYLCGPFDVLVDKKKDKKK